MDSYEYMYTRDKMFTLIPRTDRGIFLESTRAEWRKRLCLKQMHC